MDRVRRGRPRPGWEARFLAALASTGNVDHSAGRSGVGLSTAYRRRASDPAFAEAWDRALRGTDAEGEPAHLEIRA